VLLRLAQALDWAVGWHRLPLPLGLALLLAFRTTLRRHNLFSTQQPAQPQQATPSRYLTARSPDGSYNYLELPAMGSTGTRFGRNVPLHHTYPEPPERLMTPNPRTVSRELLTRERFIPATSLNLLAAAWLQFQVHDWLSHGRNESTNPWLVPLQDDDDWPERPMPILRTRADPTRTPDETGPTTFQNTATSWWDGSQIYGSGADMLARLRSGQRGKLTVQADGLLPLDENGIDLTGVNGNWWIGLSLMHTLFTLEHNALCDRLALEFPTWSDDDLFDRARLINAALMAKIHTLEWTPAMIAHPTTRLGMRLNWTTIVGSRTNHHGIPYATTEEFVAVYRMHPLLPDELTFRHSATSQVLLETDFAGIAFRNARSVLEQVGFANAMYSLATQHPGALTLHNFPRTLQRLTDLQGNLSDLAAIDVLRIRERGVPRYNSFRELLHKPRLQRFEQLSDNPEWVEQIRHVYNNDLDSVDLMVGLYAEPRPKGFGFSDTAFRIFILMASRRLESDRFFTVDYGPRIYTRTGLEWVANNDFSSVLTRHAPALAPAVRGVDNPFAPWPLARLS
jgi:hypothetical protein